MKTKGLLDFLLDAGWSVQAGEGICYCSSPGGAFRITVKEDKITEEEISFSGVWDHIRTEDDEDRMVYFLMRSGWGRDLLHRGQIQQGGGLGEGFFRRDGVRAFSVVAPSLRACRRAGLLES